MDIVSVWGEVGRRLEARGLVHGAVSETGLRRCALEFELSCNPVYPMPGLREVLNGLVHRGLPLGLVSNAQFFTPVVLGHFLGRSRDRSGDHAATVSESPPPPFAPDLTVFSYRHLRAKPDLHLFHLAGRALRDRGIPPGEALYVGNDMLNDVLASSRAGFRTALFAGDARSLRLREDREETAGLVPDAVLTDLRQLPGLLA